MCAAGTWNSTAAQAGYWPDLAGCAGNDVPRTAHTLGQRANKTRDRFNCVGRGFAIGTQSLADRLDHRRADHLSLIHI